VLGLLEAELASLFSEATTRCWDQDRQTTSPTTRGGSPFQCAPLRVGVTIVPEVRPGRALLRRPPPVSGVMWTEPGRRAPVGCSS
jgi:hypothetical protein